MKVTFIGGGNMATALITGLLKNGRSASDIRAVEIDAAARERLTRELGVEAHAGIFPSVMGAECIVLAVKPQQMRDVSLALGPNARDALVVSIAAGIRHADLTRWLGGHARLVRAMPNTPALVLSGVTGLYAPAAVSREDRTRAESVLGAAGNTLWVESEAAMDAVTAVSGSGPAYVFYFLEAIEKAATGLGFDAKTARRLALETFAGSLKLAAESTESVATLRERVTSKGGTTERALEVLDEARVRESIVAAVRAAAVRSRELGDMLGRDPDAAGGRKRD